MVETGFLVCVIERMLNLLSFASVYQWTLRLMRRIGRWHDDELVPFWFAEAYTLLWLFLLALAFCFVSVKGVLWYICLILAAYRLFDLAQGLASILVFESRRRWDKQGGYILVREPIRWVLLTLVNFGEVVLYFSFAYLTWGTEFEYPIDTRIAGIYQSTAAFLVGSGSAPTTDLARVIVILQLCYFLFFLIVVAPVVLSVIRAKERTSEVLGNDAKPDKRV